jgi:hypothetical protein
MEPIRNEISPSKPLQPKAETKTIILPSGKTAVIREASGRDLKYAQRAVGKDTDESAVMFSLIAEVTEIGGQKIVYEDVLAMKLPDVLALQKEVIGGNFQSPPPPPSPLSSK